MILNINEAITSETFDKMVIAFNQMREDEILTIYFASPGGNVGVMEAITNFINENADRIKLIGYDDLASAGFYIFFGANCEKELLPGTTGMIHLVAITTRFIGDPANWKNKDESKVWYHWSSIDKKKRISFLKKIGLTTNELKRVSDGEDLYLMPKRMIELLKNQID